MKKIKNLIERLFCNHPDYKEMWFGNCWLIRKCNKCGSYDFGDMFGRFHKIKR
jgi:hypothetical protein